jgi:hypothetical protein
MATSAITPEVSAPAAAAAPETTAAPVATPSSTETTTTTRDESTFSGPETLKFLKDELAKVPEDLAKRALAGEEVELPKPAEAAKPGQTAAEKAARELAAETPEQKLARERAAESPEAKTARETAERAAETPEAKAARELAEKNVNPLDKLGPLPAEKIAKAMAAKPELAAALKAAGLDGDTLIHNARLAAETAQYKAIAPTLEAATFMKESAGHFYDIEERFPSIQKLEDFDSFVMETMLPLSVLRNDKGEILRNADGTFQTDGSVQRFLQFASDADLGYIRNAAQQLGKAAGSDEDKEYYGHLEAAIDYLNDFRQAGYQKPGAKTTDTISPEVQRRLDAADKTVKESRERDAATQAEREKITEDRIFDDTLKGVQPTMRATLDRTALSDKLKIKAEKEIWQGVFESLKTNREYQQLKRGYWSRGMGDEQVKSLAALNVTTIEGIFASVAEKVLGEYGVDLVAANAARHTAIDTAIARDKSTPTSAATSAAAAPKVMSEDDIDNQATANVLARHGGRRTPQFNQEFLVEVVKLKQAAQGAA